VADDKRLKAKRKQRTPLTIDDKAEIIRSEDAGEKPVVIARRYGVLPSTISKIVADKERLLQAWETGAVGKRANLRGSAHPDLEASLLEWFAN
jgi:hypothetical protein